MNYANILVDKRNNVCLIRFNRPKSLNALSRGMMQELTQVLIELEADEQIGATVLTGSEKVFAAGADIKEIKNLDFAEAHNSDLITAEWEQITRCRKPIIAAVAGYALGGGCEVAMMCDFIIAADNAMFGQPEINIGTIPGAGGTQRLTKLVGKSKAMEMCLTGRMMDAIEAERSGLVSRVVPTSELLDEALKTAARIALMSRPIVLIAKEMVKQAYETHLSQGIQFERRMFHATFATEDQKEGMAAFTEKRNPVFKHR